MSTPYELCIDQKLTGAAPQFEEKPMTRKLNYDRLKTYTSVSLPVSISGKSQLYAGPALEEVLNPSGSTASYTKVRCFDEDNNRKELKADDVKDWIIAISEGTNPLTSDDGGPYLLLHKESPTNTVRHLKRIEAL
jgi:hypothetical protein